MVTDDPQGFGESLSRQRRLLEESDDVAGDDRTAIQRWLRRKDGSVKVSSLKTYLNRVRLAAERAETPLLSMDEPDWHEFVFALRHDHGLSDSTVQAYEHACLLFLGDMTDAEWPDEVERTTVDRQGPDVDEILTPKDIQALTQGARHQRDTALIEFLADTGARISLTLSLRVGDVDLSEPATYTPNADAQGLKDAPIQAYPLIDSAGALRSYLRSSHPRPDDPAVALFHKLHPASHDDSEGYWNDDGGLVAHAAREQLQRIADRAGVEKPVKPHAFRHAAITRMVREGYSRSQIEHRVHWTLDSDMWATYEHITSEEHNADIFAEAGVIEDDDSPDRVRKPCGNCGEPLAPHHDWCGNCGRPATPAAAGEVAESEEDLLDLLVETTNPATRRELRQLLSDINDRPDIAADHDDPS